MPQAETGSKSTTGPYGGAARVARLEGLIEKHKGTSRGEAVAMGLRAILFLQAKASTTVPEQIVGTEVAAVEHCVGDVGLSSCMEVA